MVLFAMPCLLHTVAFGVLAGIWQHVTKSDRYVDASEIWLNDLAVVLCQVPGACLAVAKS